MLSVLRLLIRLAEYTTLPQPWSGVIGTDSKSVLDTLGGKQDGHTRNFHEPIQIDGNGVELDVLCPEWDVLIGIQHALRLIPGIRLQFVKGHQDDTVEFQRLPLLAQLNVEADSLATEFQTTFGGDRPFVILSPRVGALLQFQSGTVTSNYASALRSESGRAPLQEHIQQRNEWSSSTMTSIHWEAHGSALCKKLKKKLHFSKMVHDILPTVSQMNKFDGGKRSCPSCPSLREDRDHIIRCPSQLHNKWRHNLLTAFNAWSIEHHTQPALQRLLEDSLRQWMYYSLEEAVPYSPRLADYPRALSRLIQSQTRIGWRQLFNGMFSREWSAHQDTHLFLSRDSLPPTARKLTGDVWQAKLISFLWDRWYQLWLIRNGALRGQDDATRQLADQRDIRRQLGAIYDQKHLMEPNVQELLCQDIQTHLQRPAWVTKNWLAIHVPLVQDSMRRVKTKAIQGVRSIRTYFVPR